jgi:hypothetical protein
MGFNVAEATNAWCIRWKRGEFLLDFPDREVFLRTLVAEAPFFFLLVCSFADEDDDD